jgi:arsenite methyltransferase
MTETPSLEALLGAELAGCCASPYDSPAVRWLLGDDLHPGGDALSRRLSHLAGLGPGSRVLDVASGHGRTARLLASEFGAEVTGVELSAQSVAAAQAETEAAGLGGRVPFVQGDATKLPAPSRAFDAVMCECALCLFPGKGRVLAEMRRVLRPGGVVAISDVTAEPDALPAALRGAAGRVACLAEALPREGYEALLHDARFELLAAESHDGALAALAERVEYRLRVARMLDGAAGYAGAIAEGITLVREASATGCSSPGAPRSPASPASTARRADCRGGAEASWPSPRRAAHSARCVTHARARRARRGPAPPRPGRGAPARSSAAAAAAPPP